MVLLTEEIHRLACKITTYLDLVKFEHTIFALPFAYVGLILASRGIPDLHHFFWVTAAMVGARTTGMALNRLVDHEIDKRNPRTCNRPLPAGLVTRKQVWILVAGSLFMLFLAAYKLNPLCLALSPIAAFLLFVYSHLKRFTYLTHVALGMVLSCAPIGGWIAVTGKLALEPFLLAAAVVFWVAGFDILYACQDIVFDREEGLYSVPQTFGTGTSLNVSKAMHFVTVLFLILVGLRLALGPFFFIGLVIVTVLLVHEHRLLSPEDISKVNQAFFNVNGWVSFTILFFTALNFLI